MSLKGSSFPISSAGPAGTHLTTTCSVLLLPLLRRYYWPIHPLLQSVVYHRWFWSRFSYSILFSGLGSDCLFKLLVSSFVLFFSFLFTFHLSILPLPTLLAGPLTTISYQLILYNLLVFVLFSDHGSPYTVHNDPYRLLSVQHGSRSLRYHRGEEAWRTTTAAQINLSPFLPTYLTSLECFLDYAVHTFLLLLVLSSELQKSFLYGSLFRFIYTAPSVADHRPALCYS